MNIPDGLPILSRGSHERASGKACIMNAISYLKGDISITDAPDCVATIIRYAFISVNDRMCHGSEESLCSECSHILWLKGIGTIGTAERWAALDEGQQLNLIYRLIDQTVIKNPYLAIRQKNKIMADVAGTIISGYTPFVVFETAIDQLTSYLLVISDDTHSDKSAQSSWILETVMNVFDAFTMKTEPVELTLDQFLIVATEAKVPVHANAH